MSCRSVLFTGLCSLGLAFPVGAHAAPNVAVTVNIGGPEIYGRVQIGRVAPPVIFEQPVVIIQPEVMLPRQPIYMRVPPGYERDWSRYCANYGACSQPVYFVQARPQPRGDRYEGRQRDEHEDHHRDERRRDHGDERHGGDRDRHGEDHQD